MIDLGVAPQPLHAAWNVALALSERQAGGWVIIGAQMVALHGMEHGRLPPRSSEDLDLLVNIRVLTDGTERVSRMLEELGLDLDGVSPTNLGHRFVGRGARVDVPPDGVGDRARLATIPPAQAVMVPGGTQALGRAERVSVRLNARTGELPRPNLAGALLLKARAVEIDDAPENQRQDLAFLLSLVEDPRALAMQLTG